MNLSDLLKKDLIRKVEPDKERAMELMALAERDLKVAENNLINKNYDWALAIAYNAMLSEARAFMAYKGYTPVAEAHHLAVVQFCAALFPSESAGLVSIFNRYRVRRHNVIYGEAESVSESEAKKAIENTKLFVEKIREKIK